jgi:hypothetical protein
VGVSRPPTVQVGACSPVRRVPEIGRHRLADTPPQTSSGPIIRIRRLGERT